MWWGDVVARSAGLRTRLLGPQAVERCRKAKSLHSLRMLCAPAMEPGPTREGATPVAAVRSLDAFLARRQERHLGILARWSGPEPQRGRRRSLAPIFDDADRRVLTALLRASASDTEPGPRPAETFATPRLPQTLLRQLATAESVDALVHMLDRAGHPAGGALASELHRPPTLLARLTALDRWWVAGAARAARHGGPPLRHWIPDVVDERNLGAALSLAGRFPGETERVAEFFLDLGGAGVPWLDRETYLRAAAASSRKGALDVLSSSPANDSKDRRPELRELLSGLPEDVTGGALTDAALADQLRTQRRHARLDPLSAAPVLVGWLELLRENRALRQTAWRLFWTEGATGGAA